MMNSVSNIKEETDDDDGNNSHESVQTTFSNICHDVANLEEKIVDDIPYKFRELEQKILKNGTEIKVLASKFDKINLCYPDGCSARTEAGLTERASKHIR